MKSILYKLCFCIAAFALIFVSSAAAFQDLAESDDAYEDIMKLQQMGIISGVDGKFHGDRPLTYAEGIHMIVKGMDLSLAAYTFIKAPEASDYFDNVPDAAWYTESLIVAAVNGLDLPSDLDPEAVMSREVFTHHLFTALQITGPYPFIELYNLLADEDSVTKPYMNSIQYMLNGRMVELDEDGRFRPLDDITRKEAAVMLSKAMEFRKHHTPISPIVSDEVTYVVDSVTDEINKVTVSWGEQPNPGYGISITGIKFNLEDCIATVIYQRSYPDPDLMYPQVIVTPTAETYVSSAYTVEIVEQLQPVLPIQPVKPVLPDLPQSNEASEAERTEQAS